MRGVLKSSNNVHISDPEPGTPWTWVSPPGSAPAKQSFATPAGENFESGATCERLQPMRWVQGCSVLYSVHPLSQSSATLIHPNHQSLQSTQSTQMFGTQRSS